ncbi:MAG: 4Fe-4S binding protein [Bacteroidetes bacterium]|nr:4Fe-4S binding protein [Bacteroidota bacterium]
MQKLSKLLISKRVIILAIIGILMFLAISQFQISLWYILGLGILTGVVFGKVFCRWMCPMGFIMEIFMGRNPDSEFTHQYQYHKMGCPIAWISGYLNKWSIFRIKLNIDTCKNCGLCDKECYISTIEPNKFSLYKKEKTNPGDSYSCSKCLKCVEVCPNGSLTYKV